MRVYVASDEERLGHTDPQRPAKMGTNHRTQTTETNRKITETKKPPGSNDLVDATGYGE